MTLADAPAYCVAPLASRLESVIRARAELGDPPGPSVIDEIVARRAERRAAARKVGGFD
jgi:hypothetical protein